VALVLPDEEGLGVDADAIETWYTDEVYALTQAKQAHNVLPKAFLKASEMPDAVAARMSQFLQGHHGGDESPVRVLFTATPSSDPTNFHQQFSTKFFHPFVVNYVGRTTEARANRDDASKEDPNLEGYGICFTNSDRSSDVRVIYDVVLMTDQPNDEVSGGKSEFRKEAHLTPLEVSLDESIRAANAVLQEMRYMEKREARMRKTAKDINTRVRWFSYLSASVLLAVTYIQVSYLKRYFHKKKLM
jgi:p24 family protein delta-1